MSIRSWLAVASLSLLPFIFGCGGDDGNSVPEVNASGEPSTAALPGGGKAAVEEEIVLFLGTSLTAGLGVDPDSAFPALVGEKIDSAGLP
ncbi:MAG: arylesterase, partial [Gemmatimonadota bacterium]|nr:arylesterase [Gemmatimonadota bacterium]